ncbi:hypothetical protein TeGR_g7789 [Tetraparma gracilis]|nr:hypothetical protein TeGR_g7789 [Tetraparma gracilis]
MFELPPFADPESGRVKLSITNPNSFRPLRLRLQFVFVNSAAMEAAVTASRDAGEAELPSSPASSAGSPVDKTAGRAAAAIGTLVLGAGAVATGGVGALAGGVLVAALGGGGMIIKDQLLPRLTASSSPPPPPESEEPPEPTREEILEMKMVELSRLTTTTLAEERERQEKERAVWVEKEALLKQKEEAARADAVEQMKAARDAYQGRLDDAKTDYKRREDELLGSVLELESAVRKLKREKKVLVMGVKEERRQRDEAEVKLKADAQEARMSPLEQLKDKHKQLSDMLAKDPHNAELRTLVENIGRNIEQAEAQARAKQGLNFVR